MSEPRPDAAQLALAELWPCTTCDHIGRVEHHETGVEVPCPSCHGSGTLDYDPDDLTVIPY